MFIHLEVVLVDYDGFIGGFADGAVGIVVEVAEAEHAGSANVIVAAGEDGAVVGYVVGVAD